MIYVFGAYELDTDRRVLCLAGTPVDVEPKVFDLLAYLIQHHDQFVSRDTLYAQLWSQPFVSEAALTYCIAEARKAVGDNGRAQRVIKTVYGRGYRFKISRKRSMGIASAFPDVLTTVVALSSEL